MFDVSNICGVSMRIETRSDLARLVKVRRQAQGRTQAEVAEAVGITRQSLARIEQGNGGTSFDSVLKVLSEVGIRLEAETETLRVIPPAERPTTQGVDTSALMTKAFQNVDYSAISRALAAGVQRINASALAASATRNLNTAAIVSAMTAGIKAIPHESTTESREGSEAHTSRSNPVPDEGDPSSRAIPEDGNVPSASSGDVSDD
jgi:transcriptional regulator with XRE-family HTH domain